MKPETITTLIRRRGGGRRERYTVEVSSSASDSSDDEYARARVTDAPRSIERTYNPLFDVLQSVINSRLDSSLKGKSIQDW